MWSDDSLSGRGQCNVVSTFLDGFVPLHNLLHSMIRRLRSHRSLGLMVHSSPVFHDRVPNMEVPATFAHDNGQVLLGLPWSAFLLAAVCNVRFLQSQSK